MDMASPSSDGAPQASLLVSGSSSRRDSSLASKLQNATSLTFQVLREITDNFSEERKIGQGGYGTVYKGVHDNGEEVAVKLLRNNATGTDDVEFQREFETLTRLEHHNVVRLVGYCYETHHRPWPHEGKTVFAGETYRALCLEYMPNGSLEKHLSDECHGLDWHTRYKIIKGTCQGLQYLHEGSKEPIYHLDLKPDNILLDKNMIPKLADFGLSKLFGGELTMITQSRMGTLGYLPPEYLFEGRVSKKLDIFSLGVVMTKIIAGPEGLTRSDLDQVQESWRNRLQATCRASWTLEAFCQQVNICAGIALSCMEMDRHKRPSIVNIIHKLNETETFLLRSPVKPPAPPPPPPPRFTSTSGRSSNPEKTRSQSYAKRSDKSSWTKSEKIHLIDRRRATQCGIILTLVNLPLPDLMCAILTLDDTVLDADQVESLINITPNKEETELLKGYSGDEQLLGKCEQFFMELMKLPRADSKLRVFSFKIQFRSRVSDLKRNLNIVKSSAEEIRGSVKLKKVMQAILSIGNALDQGTTKGSRKKGTTTGSAFGFRLGDLTQLVGNTRYHNNQMTLIHYYSKMVSEKLPELLDFPTDLANLELAAMIRLKSLAEEMHAICKGLEKVKQELTTSENDGRVSEIFRKKLKGFLSGAEADVTALRSLYLNAGRNADDLIRYFGEDPERCSFEQVVKTLHDFVRSFMLSHEENRKRSFMRSHEENRKQLDDGFRTEESSERSRNGES